MDVDERTTENKDADRNLVKVLHNALQEAVACAGYALGAEATGNERLAEFFREVQRIHARIAERTEGILGVKSTPALVASKGPTDVQDEGDPDPGDVTPGQDVVSAAEVPPELSR